MIKQKLEILGNIGLFLLGISSLFFAILFGLNFFKVEHYSPYLSAYCQKYNNQTAIIVHSYGGDFKNIEIYDKNNNLVCKIKELSKDSEDYCLVNDGGIFKLKVGNLTKVIICYDDIIYGKIAKPVRVD